jgi:hypothetical protein
MTPSQLREHLPSLREIFPSHIQMEWSSQEYLRSAKDLNRRLLTALDRWDGKVSWLVGEDDIPL